MIPEWLDAETWDDFLQYRTECGKRMSGIAQKRMLRRLERLHAEGYDANALLDMAMSEGWQGVWKHDECKRQIRRLSFRDGPQIRLVEGDRDVAAAGLKAARKAL